MSVAGEKKQKARGPKPRQKRSTFTGMGTDINIHDQFACESPGPIADRTKENLGSTDKGIVLYRRLLVDALLHFDAQPQHVQLSG